VKSKLRGLARGVTRQPPREKKAKEAEEEVQQQQRRSDVTLATAMSMSKKETSSARCFFLDCDEALPGIVAHLDGKGLAALSSTCKALRDLVGGDGDGKRWWKRLCRNLLVRGCFVFFCFFLACFTRQTRGESRIPPFATLHASRGRSHDQHHVERTNPWQQGKTVCAVHLEAAGGASVADTARFWRHLYKHALNADTFHWHAESSRRAWGSVHAADEAHRLQAFTAAATAGVAGPYVARVNGREFHHDNIRLGISSGELGYAPHGHPDVEACKREIRRRAELAVAPQMGPDLMRSGHTSTLIDDLGLVVGLDTTTFHHVILCSQNTVQLMTAGMIHGPCNQSDIPRSNATTLATGGGGRADEGVDAAARAGELGG
jgi:hypothetical protein